MISNSSLLFKYLGKADGYLIFDATHW